jgi:hypothetical protein
MTTPATAVELVLPDVLLAEAVLLVVALVDA